MSRVSRDQIEKQRFSLVQARGILASRGLSAIAVVFSGVCVCVCVCVSVDHCFPQSNCCFCGEVGNNETKGCFIPRPRNQWFSLWQAATAYLLEQCVF